MNSYRWKEPIYDDEATRRQQILATRILVTYPIYYGFKIRWFCRLLLGEKALFVSKKQKDQDTRLWKEKTQKCLFWEELYLGQSVR